MKNKVHHLIQLNALAAYSALPFSPFISKMIETKVLLEDLQAELSVCLGDKQQAKLYLNQCYEEVKKLPIPSTPYVVGKMKDQIRLIKSGEKLQLNKQ